jgi:hypothetical protein
MTTMVKSLLLLLALTFAARGMACEYPKEVTVGECKGVLLSDNQFIEASNNKRKVRLQEMKIAALEGTIELMDMRHESYRKDLRETENELENLKITSKFGYVISFSLGAVLTGVIAKELLR